MSGIRWFRVEEGGEERRDKDRRGKKGELERRENDNRRDN
jgi:hypothetical protein